MGVDGRGLKPEPCSWFNHETHKTHETGGRNDLSHVALSAHQTVSRGPDNSTILAALQMFCLTFVSFVWFVVQKNRSG